VNISLAFAERFLFLCRVGVKFDHLTNMFLKQALDALQDAAQHPLAIGMYILLVAGWFLISWRVKRHRSLLRHLKKLPEKDRLKALELEMGPLPKRGINAEQWLRARAQTFNLARLAILCLTLVIVLTLAVYYYLNAGPGVLTVSGSIFLDGAPLPEAKITLAGVDSEWHSVRSGAFTLQPPDLFISDSIAIIVSYSTPFEKLRLDTTIAKSGLQGLRLHLASTKTCTVAGYVLEERTGNAVVGGRIVLDGNRGGGVTDENGFFRFEAKGKPNQQVDATISHPQYLTKHPGLLLDDNNRIVLKRK